MKKNLFVILMFLTVSVSGMAKEDKQINVQELPSGAKLFLNSYFAGETVENVVQEAKTRDYEVTMKSGKEFDFDESGTWKEVDCNTVGVPSSLVPTAILNKVASRYGIGVQVIGIKRTKKGYEVELNNGVEVYFNKRFKIVTKKF